MSPSCLGSLTTRSPLVRRKRTRGVNALREERPATGGELDLINIAAGLRDLGTAAGATILGRVTIGRGSSIGGNVWLTRDAPPGSVITQGRALNESFDDGGGI
jgi:hypothetical protein